MSFYEEIHGNVAIVFVDLSRASIKEADEFKKHIVDILNKGVNKIIVDLTKVEFIDSTFLGILVSSLKKSVQKNGDLKLVGFQPAVKSMFELTRMLRVFDSFNNVEDAFNSFSE